MYSKINFYLCPKLFLDFKFKTICNWPFSPLKITYISKFFLFSGTKKSFKILKLFLKRSLLNQSSIWILILYSISYLTNPFYQSSLNSYIARTLIIYSTRYSTYPLSSDLTSTWPIRRALSTWNIFANCANDFAHTHTHTLTSWLPMCVCVFMIL